MPNIYIHYLGNESSNSLLEAYGIEKHNQKEIDILKIKSCPNCGEENRPDSRFCARCKMVLSYDAYNETLQMQEKQKLDMTKIDGVLAELAQIKQQLGLEE